MKIRKLILHNFGVYASTNEFDFNGRKPIVLIGGMNGRGKTTFLEGVLLALYGSNSFAYAEGNYQSYNQYLRSYINKKDGSLEAYVEMYFSLDKKGKEEYRIRREWNAISKRTSEKISVERNGEYNQFLTENWSMFVENMLPSGLSNFFFFDGEKIAALAEEPTSKQMKESIKALLGINVLDILESDLNRVVNKATKRTVSDEETKRLESLRKAKEDADLALNDIDLEIAAIEKSIVENEKALSKARQDYSVNGGDVAAQREKLYKKKTEIEANIKQNQNTLEVLAGSALPLMMVRPELELILETAKKEQESRLMKTTISHVDMMLKKYLITHRSGNKAINSFVDYIKESSSEDIEPIFNLSDMTLLQLQAIVENKLSAIIEKVESLKKEQKKNRRALLQNESYLNVELDEKRLEKSLKKIKDLETKAIEYKVRLEDLGKKRIHINGEVIAANAAFNKNLETYLSKAEGNDENSRTIKYANMASRILDEYKIRLQKEKVLEVAETMTHCYKRLANKKNMIDEIQMNPITLDLIYRDKDGVEVPRISLSAGEKQLMVISLLWSLAICSKKKLPVIIDTPLSRMDSAHRMGLINIYFPKASEQTIILSTDSEIDEHYYEVMKKNIGDEFTLIYDDESKATTVKRGYLLGDVNDN